MSLGKTVGREVCGLLRDSLVIFKAVGEAERQKQEAERQKQEAAVKYLESIGVYEWMSPELKAQMIMLAAIRETIAPKPIRAATNPAPAGVLEFPHIEQDALLQTALSGQNTLLVQAVKRGRKVKRFTKGQMAAYKIYESERSAGAIVQAIKWPQLYELGLKIYNPENESGDTPEKRGLRRLFKDRYARSFRN
jgi:predicted amidohydrolase YtcJ